MPDQRDPLIDTITPAKYKVLVQLDKNDDAVTYLAKLPDRKRNFRLRVISPEVMENQQKQIELENRRPAPILFALRDGRTYEVEQSPIQIVCCHVEADQESAAMMERYLAELVRSHRIKLYHGGQIWAGAKRDQWTQWLQTADLIVVLVSPLYIQQPGGWPRLEGELQKLDRDVLLIPVMISSVAALPDRLGGVKCLPRGGGTVSSSESTEAGWFHVAEDIVKFVTMLESGDL